MKRILFILITAFTAQFAHAATDPSYQCNYKVSAMSSDLQESGSLDLSFPGHAILPIHGKKDPSKTYAIRISLEANFKLAANDVMFGVYDTRDEGKVLTTPISVASAQYPGSPEIISTFYTGLDAKLSLRCKKVNP